HYGVSEDLSVRNPGIPHFPQRDLWGIRGDFTSPVSTLTRQLGPFKMVTGAVNRLGSHEQVPRATRSGPFLAFVLRDPRLHQFLNKCSRQWLVRGEVDGPFGCGEALKFVLERLDHGRSREQTAMVRKRGEPHQRSFVLECRYPVADGLGSLRWHSGPNRRANLVQRAAGRFRDASKVFVDVFRSAVAFRGRTAIARFHFFHAGNATRSSNSSLCLSPACSCST